MPVFIQPHQITNVRLSAGVNFNKEAVARILCVSQWHYRPWLLLPACPQPVARRKKLSLFSLPRAAYVCVCVYTERAGEEFRNTGTLKEFGFVVVVVFWSPFFAFFLLFFHLVYYREQQEDNEAAERPPNQPPIIDFQTRLCSYLTWETIVTVCRSLSEVSHLAPDH